MHHLIKRSLREIKSNLTQFISIVLIIAVGSAIFSGLFSTIDVLSHFLDEYYTNYKMADAWVYVKGLTEDDVQQLESSYPNLNLQSRLHIDIESVLDGESVTYRFMTQTDLNTFKLEEGTDAFSNHEILIDASFAQTNQLSLQDQIVLPVGEDFERYTIVGIFNSPEYAYKSVDFSDASSNKKGFGIIVTSENEVKNLIEHTDDYLTLQDDILKEMSDAEVKLKDAQVLIDENQSDLSLQISNFNQEKAVLPPQQAQIIQTQLSAAQIKLDTAQSELDDKFAEFEVSKVDALDELAGYSSRTSELLIQGSETDIQALSDQLKTDDLLAKTLLKADHPAYAMVHNILKPIEVMTTIFPILFFIVSAIVILISMSKTVQNERMQIAIFRGLGLSLNSIRLSYLWYGWWAALLGSIPFAVLGNLVIPQVLVGIFTTRFSFPVIPIQLFPLYILLSVLMAFFFASVAIVFAIRPILKEIPAQGMRPQLPKSTRRSLLEKYPSFWKKLSYTTKLILRNLQVSKAKLLLSSIGIVGSVALLVTGLSLRQSANLMINSSISTYDFDYAIKLEDDTSIQDVNFPTFVKRIEAQKSMNAEFQGDTIGLSLYQAHTQLYTFTAASGTRIDLNSDEVWVTTILARNYDLTVGDTLDLLVEEEPIQVTITNITNQYLGKDVILSLDHAQRLGIDTTTNRYVLSSREEASETGSNELLDQSLIASVDTKDKYASAASEIMGMLNNIITIIVISALILSVTVIYNLASINIFERRRELATLRVLGYTIFEVGHLIYTENYILWFLGTIGGIPAGIVLYQSIARMVSTPEFLMMDTIQLSTLGLVVLLSFFFTWLTNRFLSIKVRRIEFVESLKGVE